MNYSLPWSRLCVVVQYLQTIPQHPIPNEEFGAKWLERHVTCGLEICRKTSERIVSGSISNDMGACRASSCCHGARSALWTEVPAVPLAKAMRAVPVPVQAAAAVAGAAVPRPAGVRQRRWRSWISSPQRRHTRLSIRWTSEPSPHSTTSHNIFSTGSPLTEVQRIMDPAAVAGEEVAEQAAFPAAAAAVAGAPVPGSAAAAVAANEETGEARISTHVVPTAASTVARGATEWLAPGVAASSAAAVAVAAASAVIQPIHRRRILAATYPAVVHHLRALIT